MVSFYVVPRRARASARLAAASMAASRGVRQIWRSPLYPKAFNPTNLERLLGHAVKG